MPRDDDHDVTRLLAAVGAGERDAPDRLLAVVYDELRDMAGARMAALRPDQTLQPTALVHEAYMRLVGEDETTWDSRRHFFGAAALAMRNVLVDQARARGRLKRGGGRRRLPFDESLAVDPDASDDLLALDEALRRLEASDPARSDVVMLRYFAGLSIPKIAELLGVSRATVERRWAYARAWLHRELAGEVEA